MVHPFVFLVDTGEFMLLDESRLILSHAHAAHESVLFAARRLLPVNVKTGLLFLEEHSLCHEVPQILAGPGENAGVIIPDLVRDIDL